MNLNFIPIEPACGCRWSERQVTAGEIGLTLPRPRLGRRLTSLRQHQGDGWSHIELLIIILHSLLWSEWCSPEVSRRHATIHSPSATDGNLG